jgi:hypothetical protein
MKRIGTGGQEKYKETDDSSLEGVPDHVVYSTVQIFLWESWSQSFPSFQVTQRSGAVEFGMATSKCFCLGKPYLRTISKQSPPIWSSQPQTLIKYQYLSNKLFN